MAKPVVSSRPIVNLDAPPETFNFSTDVIDKWAQNPGLKAMIWTDTADPKASRKDLTYEYFSNRSHRAARWMYETLGIRTGDRLILMLPRVPDWWEILFGAIRLGAVVVPCTTLLTSKDIEYRIGASHAKAFISDESGAEKFQRISNAASVGTKILVSHNTDHKLDGWHSYPEGIEHATKDGDHFEGVRTKARDPCIIYFTSGTSGPPKMALHTHISYPLGHFVTGELWLQLSPGDVYWNISELGWVKAAWATFGCWSMGATLFIQDERGAFNPERVIRMLHEFEITTFCAPPTAYRQLVLKERVKLFEENKPKALGSCFGAGEALNPEVLNTWKQTTGLDIYEGYGQSETVLLCGNFPGTSIRSGSMGKAPPRIPLSLVDDTGKELPHGVEGHIAVRTSPPVPWIFDGYVKEDGSVKLPEVVNPTTGQHWYITGDRATRDEDGCFWFVGRADDVINTAGYRVGPFELESVIKEHKGVVESAVVASPDPDRGEIVKAFIVLTDDYRPKASPELAAEIQNFVAQTTAPYKKPREIEFVDSLPKTVSGKIRRVELRAQEKEKKSKSRGGTSRI